MSLEIAEFEPQGDRRRRQLIDVAAALIAAEGVDAVRIPRVAELAGVGRTAVYRYFPAREPLLDAVLERFDERLRERIDEARFAEGMHALADDGDPGVIGEATLKLFEAIWDVLLETGPAGLILRAQAPVDARDDHRPDRFAQAMLEIGLNELQATLFGDSANAITTRLYFRAQRGEIDREEAIRIGHRSLVALLHGLREP